MITGTRHRQPLRLEVLRSQASEGIRELWLPGVFLRGEDMLLAFLDMLPCRYMGGFGLEMVLLCNLGWLQIRSPLP